MFEDKDPQRTSLESLGEFGLIHHLTREFKMTHPATRVGVGDDAAVLKTEAGAMAWSTDMLVEGVHFDLAYTPLAHLGYKAVVVNLSDICAMGMTPSHITVSLAVSNRFPLEALEELYSGIRRACEVYKVDLVGGDTTSSTRGLILSLSVMGMASEDAPVLRKGASPNDLLVVSGDLGGAYMGLQVLRREQEVFKANPNHRPDLEPYAYIVERQLKPEARADVVELLQKLEVRPTAMIDISDGLSSETLHLCQAGEVGCALYEEKIPLDPTVISVCEEFNLDSTTIALSGGEDYELLFTIAQEDYPKIKGNPNLTVIGHMTEASAGTHLITRAGTSIPLQARGWNAFDAE
ncbi:thiamine-phosphate kinase [Robiginitalea sp. M366]|uniref:thiamine-phosphate kinase n=1 Tax=Robiginitalea aestuariiviva TaxID=3036903 RepID=UPI00240D9487|nr:thiamine-phosphate kinase [Robiginitalea aestuariiviva]MDG1571355.1 thiamine-phosphate kinase [Robiginitalea aestuariiviva]